MKFSNILVISLLFAAGALFGRLDDQAIKKLTAKSTSSWTQSEVDKVIANIQDTINKGDSSKKTANLLNDIKNKWNMAKTEAQLKAAKEAEAQKEKERIAAEAEVKRLEQENAAQKKQEKAQADAKKRKQEEDAAEEKVQTTREEALKKLGERAERLEREAEEAKKRQDEAETARLLKEQQANKELQRKLEREQDEAEKAKKIKIEEEKAQEKAREEERKKLEQEEIKAEEEAKKKAKGAREKIFDDANALKKELSQKETEKRLTKEELSTYKEQSKVAETATTAQEILAIDKALKDLDFEKDYLNQNRELKEKELAEGRLKINTIKNRPEVVKVTSVQAYADGLLNNAQFKTYDKEVMALINQLQEGRRLNDKERTYLKVDSQDINALRALEINQALNDLDKASRLMGDRSPESLARAETSISEILQRRVGTTQIRNEAGVMAYANRLLKNIHGLQKQTEEERKKLEKEQAEKEAATKKSAEEYRKEVAAAEAVIPVALKKVAHRELLGTSPKNNEVGKLAFLKETNASARLLLRAHDTIRDLQEKKITEEDFQKRIGDIKKEANNLHLPDVYQALLDAQTLKKK